MKLYSSCGASAAAAYLVKTHSEEENSRRGREASGLRTQLSLGVRRAVRSPSLFLSSLSFPLLLSLQLQVGSTTSSRQVPPKCGAAAAVSLSLPAFEQLHFSLSPSFSLLLLLLLLLIKVNGARPSPYRKKKEWLHRGEGREEVGRGTKRWARVLSSFS